jgi:hypothetical protein
MRRYINSSSGINLADLYNGIYTIIVVDDASEYNIEYDDYDLELDDMTDDELASMSADDISATVNYDVWERIYRLCPDKLTDSQRHRVEIISSINGGKYTLNEHTVNDAIAKLKRCNNIEIEKSPLSNKDFSDNYSYTKAQALDIIHNLTYDDFAHFTRSNSDGHNASDLLVFIVENKKPFTNKKSGDTDYIMVYIKIDYTKTTSDGNTIAVVSFHKAREGTLGRDKNRNLPKWTHKIGK